MQIDEISLDHLGIESHFIDPQYRPRISLVRDDLLHPIVSGNKWRKLSHLFPTSLSSSMELKQLPSKKSLQIMSVGGIHSNHIDALSYAGFCFGWKVHIWVRGLTSDQLHSPDRLTPTLQRALNNGTTLIPCTRKEYDTQKSLPYFGLNLTPQERKKWIWLEEGGSTAQAIETCRLMVDEIRQTLISLKHSPFTQLGVSIGSGTTAYGLALGLHRHEKLRIYSPFKSSSQQEADTFVHDLLSHQHHTYITYFNRTLSPLPHPSKTKQLNLCTQAHYGGFGRPYLPLIEWMNDFYQKTRIPLDPIYTGKMIYALRQEIIEQTFTNKEHIALIHTGGLQGIEGMNRRIKKQGIQILFT